jgi:hypothetical protein
MAQQATGATAFAAFGPQYFKLLVGGGQKDLLLTAIFGAVKVIACGVFVLFVADGVGRRPVLVGGAIFMAACQITTAAVVKEMPPPSSGDVTSSGIATVALIYLFVIAYNFSWGPLPWPYVAEYVSVSFRIFLRCPLSAVARLCKLTKRYRIFPTRIREPGVAIGGISHWLFSFVFSISTPYMMSSMGWGVFLLWGLFDVVIAVYAYFCLKETKGLSLEKIAHQEFKIGSPREDVAFQGVVQDNMIEKERDAGAVK